MTRTEKLKKELEVAKETKAELKVKLDSVNLRIKHLEEKLKDEELNTQGVGDLTLLNVDMLIGKIANGETYEEAGYPKRNGWIKCDRDIVRHIDIQGWKSSSAFYAALPEYLKRKRIFTVPILGRKAIRFVPTEHRIAIIKN